MTGLRVLGAAVGLGNMLNRTEVAQCMANLVKSTQVTGAPKPVAQGA